MSTATQRSIAKAKLAASGLDGPNRMVDVEIGKTLGWRVSHDNWWNWRGPDQPDDPPGDGWCIRRDARSDVPCNEPLPTFTFMPRRDAEEIIEGLRNAPGWLEDAP